MSIGLQNITTPRKGRENVEIACKKAGIDDDIPRIWRFSRYNDMLPFLLYCFNFSLFTTIMHHPTPHLLADEDVKTVPTLPTMTIPYPWFRCLFM
jgi:hypothetical protein